MASPNIHLAIAKRYLEKSGKAKNYEQFIDGTIYPDAKGVKKETHYTDIINTSELKNHLLHKVNLYRFLLSHEHLDDFSLGWFLHLITDFLFFSECFNEDYLDKVDYKDFCKNLYYAYDCTNKYVWDKYNLTMDDLKKYPNEYYPGFPSYKECVLSKKQVDNFIERVSSIDIDEYIKKILEYKFNVKP